MEGGNVAKLCLCCIFKDDSEYELAERMLTSFMPYFQGLVVALTGTSQNFKRLERLLKKYNAHVIKCSPKTHPQIYAEVNGKTIFADFAAARNVTFDYADQNLTGYDFYSWADIDDILIGGENLQKVAEMALQNPKHPSFVFMTYWYSVRLNKDGTFNETNVEIDQVRERLIRPGLFRWKSRLHEILLPKDDNYKPTISDWKYLKEREFNVIWVHLSTTERADKAAERNVEILKLQLEDEKWKDPRTIAYLAKIYFDYDKPEYDDQVIDLIENKYLTMSGWEEDRSFMWNFLAKTYRRKGDMAMAIECFFSAIQEYPKRIMNYIDLAQAYFDTERFEFAEFWVDMALRMDKPKSDTIANNPLIAMFNAAGIKTNLALKKLDLNEAIRWAKVQDEVARDNPNKEIIKELEEAKYFNQIAESFFNAARYLKDKGYGEKAQKLLEAIPNEYSGEPWVYKVANEVVPPKTWGDNSIVYYASFGVQHISQWSPKSLNEGLGGSETAVIELARKWVKKGFKVTVFCDCGEEAGMYEGVEYKPYWAINWSDNFNILILHRSPHLLDLDLHAKHLWMDYHDVLSNLDHPKNRVDKVEKFFFKSKFQRSMVPNIPDSKSIIISNGISLTE